MQHSDTACVINLIAIDYKMKYEPLISFVDSTRPDLIMPFVQLAGAGRTNPLVAIVISNNMSN